MTFWNSRSGEKPSETADLISSGSTVRTPLMVLSRIGKNAGVDHDRDLRRLADTENENEDRQQRQRRGVAEQFQQRIEEVGDRLVPGDGDSDRNGERHRDRESGQRAAQTGRGVVPQLTVADELAPALHHGGERRQEDLVDQAESWGELPEAPGTGRLRSPASGAARPSGRSRRSAGRAGGIGAPGRGGCGGPRRYQRGFGGGGQCARHGDLLSVAARSACSRPCARATSSCSSDQIWCRISLNVVAGTDVVVRIRRGRDRCRRPP